MKTTDQQSKCLSLKSWLCWVGVLPLLLGWGTVRSYPSSSPGSQTVCRYTRTKGTLYLIGNIISLWTLEQEWDWSLRSSRA